jgi:outer membrane immunogenic protein
MGGSDLSFSSAPGFCILACGPVSVLNRVTQDVDMVTLRVNYRFGDFGAPVVSRY